MTQIDLDQYDTQQQVSFAAIDPDWNSAILEAANATATQLRSNANAVLNAIDQYCVSTDVRGFTTTTSSLSVQWPTFLAIFAAGSNILTLGNNSTPLTASATNFVWINANGSYTVNLSATPVQGAILLGIFQTNSTGVIGATLKASIGVIKIGVGNINVASTLPAPSGSSMSVANGNSLNGIAADVVLSGTLTNVPSSAIALAWFYRLAVASGGNGTWLPYGETNLAAASGSAYPATTQAVSFEYGDLTNGASYDFGVAYESLGGFGPVTTAVTSFAARAIAIPNAYLLNTTFTPTVSNVTITPTPTLSGSTANLTVNFTITNQPTDGSLQRIAVYFHKTGTTQGYSPWTTIAAAAGASGFYSVEFCDLSNGVAYDFGCAGVNMQGGQGAITTIGTSTAQTVALPVGYSAAGTLPTPTIATSPAPSAAAAAALSGLAARFGTTFTITNQPTDGSLSRVAVFLRVTGTNWSEQFSVPAAGLPSPSASQQYYVEFADCTAGVSYDVGVAFENAQGGESAVASVVTGYMPAAIAISSAYMLGGTAITPSVSNQSISTPVSANGLNAAVALTFTITNQPTDGSLSRVSYWVRQSSLGGSNTIGGSNFNWSPYGGSPAVGVGQTSPSASGTYSNFNVADLTNGTTYDFGVSFENAQGGESTIAVIESTYMASTLNLPAGANASIPSSILANGPSVTSSSYGAQVNQGTGAPGQPIVFSVNDFPAGSPPGWFAGYLFWWRVHGDTTTAPHPAGTLGVTTSVTNIPFSVLLGAGGTYDIGISYEGADSTVSKIVWPSGISNIYVAPVIGSSLAGVPAGASLTATWSFKVTKYSSTPNVVTIECDITNISTGVSDTSWISTISCFYGLQNSGQAVGPFQTFYSVSGANGVPTSLTLIATGVPLTNADGKGHFGYSFTLEVNAFGTGGATGLSGIGNGANCTQNASNVTVATMS